jgi:hypothetical protein
MVWALAKPRTETLSAMAAIVAVACFAHTTGFAELMGNLENVGTAGALVYGLWLRKHRGVPPVPPRQRDERDTCNYEQWCCALVSPRCIVPDAGCSFLRGFAGLRRSTGPRVRCGGSESRSSCRR